MSLRISLALLISLAAVGRKTTNFTRMMDQTADYNGDYRAEQSISNLGGVFSPKRVEARLTDVYIHPHEMDNGDYFLGAWVKTVISHAYWDHSKPRKSKKKK